jgi:hypothetical protein
LPYQFELLGSPEEMRLGNRNRGDHVVRQILVRPQSIEKRAILANAAPHHHPLYRRSDGFFPGCREAQADPACNLFSELYRRAAPGHWTPRCPFAGQARSVFGMKLSVETGWRIIVPHTLTAVVTTSWRAFALFVRMT